MQPDFATILQSLAVLALAALVAVAVFWLRTWRSSATIAQQQSAVDQLAGYARLFVAAAEQMFISNPARFDYVLEQLHNLFPDVDETLIRACIEAAVHELPPSPPVPVNSDALLVQPTQTASSPPAKIARSHTPSPTATPAQSG
jgi:hypothetical protein